MRLSLIIAQALAATALASPAMFKRQDIEAESGNQVSGGPSSISTPTVNNGQLLDSSFVSSGTAGSDVYANNIGTSFTTVNSNSANKGNINNNVHVTTVNGNSGLTANGANNNIGGAQNAYYPADIFSIFTKRDSVVTGAKPVDHPVLTAAAVGEPVYAYPGYPGYGYPGYGYPSYIYPSYGYPDYGHLAYGFGAPAHVSTKGQDASIVQNQN
ncbi:hypothetical protein LPJ66_007325 [Kickxella alabastrina]|uniref:Uncharacterized protein n=1 Tax=Kickxella alabastrina TaxID=61397 RepID=A0ACC1I9R5_9FUNG|nr:hypothetical protein LPJ66_007325 [Kickxella alabastrina]